MPGTLIILQILLMGKDPLPVLSFTSLLLNPNLLQIHLTESEPLAHNLAASEARKQITSTWVLSIGHLLYPILDTRDITGNKILIFLEFTSYGGR